MKRPAGYTLLELLVVITIMSALVAVTSGTGISWVGAMRSTAAAQRVGLALLEARDTAMETGHEVVVQTARLMPAGPQAKPLRSSKELVFYPDGSDSGGIVRFKVFGREKSVLIDPITGRVDLSQ